MIALSRKYGSTHIIKTFPDDLASNLFDVARLGDTMHILPDVPHTSEELIREVNNQLMQGKGKVIRL